MRPSSHPVLKAEFRLIQTTGEFLVKTVSLWHTSLPAKARAALPRRRHSVACNYPRRTAVMPRSSALRRGHSPESSLSRSSPSALPRGHAAAVAVWLDAPTHASLGPHSGLATAAAMKKNTARGYGTGASLLLFATAPCTMRGGSGIPSMGPRWPESLAGKHSQWERTRASQPNGAG